MTDAIEAGARAIIDFDMPPADAEHLSKRVIEAAIASGALVPASAVAEMRERCAQAGWKAAYDSGQIRRHTDTPDEVANAIRQLDIAPACGDYVVVPKEALLILAERGEGWPSNEYVKAIDEIETALNAASRTGGEK